MTFALKTKLTTDRVDDTVRFYQCLFDMEVAEDWDHPGDRGTILRFKGGVEEALLEIYAAAEPFNLDGVSLQFKTEDVDEFVAGLPAGLAFRGPIDRPWGSRYVYLQDPAGVQVIVYEGGY